MDLRRCFTSDPIRIPVAYDPLVATITMNHHQPWTNDTTCESNGKSAFFRQEALSKHSKNQVKPTFQSGLSSAQVAAWLWKRPCVSNPRGTCRCAAPPSWGSSEAQNPGRSGRRATVLWSAPMCRSSALGRRREPWHLEVLVVDHGSWWLNGGLIGGLMVKEWRWFMLLIRMLDVSWEWRLTDGLDGFGMVNH